MICRVFLVILGVVFIKKASFNFQSKDLLEGEGCGNIIFIQIGGGGGGWGVQSIFQRSTFPRAIFRILHFLHVCIAHRYRKF